MQKKMKTPQALPDVKSQDTLIEQARRYSNGPKVEVVMA
jgi:hypothetical protein